MTDRKAFSISLRQAVLDKTEGRCSYCGTNISIDGFAVDHFVPLAKGGTNDFDNLMPSCAECNTRKNAMDIERFRERIDKYFDRFWITQACVNFPCFVPYGNWYQIRFYFEYLNKLAEG